MDKEDLNDFISHNLHELTWKHDYPINPNVLTWCFLEGMIGAGFKIDTKKDFFRIFDIFESSEEIYELNTKISQKDILLGWGTPSDEIIKASPRNAYFAMYHVIDLMQETIKEKFCERKIPKELSDDLFIYRPNKAHEVLKIFEENLLEYFEKNHEGILTPLGLEFTEITKPKILENLISKDIINFDRINQAIAYTRFEGCVLSNIEDTISFLGHNKVIEDGGYVEINSSLGNGYKGITENGVYNYVWGVYLLELAKMKNYSIRKYDLEDTEYGILEFSCDVGWNILNRRN